MTLINVDTRNPEALERPAYEPLEPGQLDLEITNDLEVKPSKNSASDGINYGNIKVELTDPESNKKVTDYLPLHPKMAWKLNSFAASAGIEENDEGQVDLAEFKGRIVRCIVTQEPYTAKDGSTKLSNKIDSYVY